MDKRQLTLQELIRRRQAGGFVGRHAQLGLFEENLGLPVEDPRRRFLFSVHGDAGVGKTYLVRQFVRVARERGYVTAYVDEAFYDVVATMEAVVDDLERQGMRCKEFREQLGVYRQRRSELDSDPTAPEGLSSLLTRSAVRIGLRTAGDVPFIGAVAEELNADAVASQVDQLRVFLSQKFRNHTDVWRLMAPVEVLTPVFLAEVATVAGRYPIAMFFDTYERTCTYLEGWLLDLLAGRHGSLPSNLVFTISGQCPLDVNRWGDYLGIHADMGLEVFTDAEARQLMADRGVIDPSVVEVILGLSGRLPVLVAMLAEARPQDAGAVGDPSGSAVERFLKWETDPRRRMAAQHGALPRRLDQEIFAEATGSPTPVEDFAWLCRLPFVAEHPEGFQYHDVVRTAMLRVIRRIAPRGWQQRHAALADHYRSVRDALGLSGRAAWTDARWQSLAVEEHYHRLCAHTTSALAAARAGLVDALAWHKTSIRRWTQMIEQAGKDAEAPGVVACGEQLSQWSDQDNDGHLRMLSDLAEDTTLDDQHRGDAYYERGLIHREQGHHDEALADYSRAIDLNPKSDGAITNRGITYGEMGRYEEALTDFARAIDLHPESDGAIVNRGITYRLMGRYEEALTDFTRAIDLNPKSDGAIASRGETYQGMGQYEEALRDFARAIDLNPESDWVIAQRGETYRLMERYEEALRDFARAIDLDPEYRWAIAQRGQTYRLMERYEEALRDFARAIDLDPEYRWAIAQRGQTYRLMERYEEALTDFTRAIDLNPESDWVIAQRGETYRLMERYEEALTDFTRAIDLNPESDWVIAQRGETYRLMERYEEALTDFARAIDLDPEYLWAIAQRGKTYQGMGRYEEALTDFAWAIDLDESESGWGHYQMALVSFARGCADDARGRLQRALDVEREQILTRPGDGWRGFNVAVYLMALGARDEASEQVRVSLDRGASRKEILDAIHDFEDLRMATGSDVSDLLSALCACLC